MIELLDIRKNRRSEHADVHAVATEGGQTDGKPGNSFVLRRSIRFGVALTSQTIRLDSTGASEADRRYYRLTAVARKRLALEHSKWEQMAAAITRVMRPA